MSKDSFDFIEKHISQTPLYTLLGAEGIEDLRSRIIDIICDEIRDGLRESHYYLIAPDDVNETLGNIVEEAVEELKAEYKDIIKNYMAKKLDAMMG